jgi:hypothetical protein
MKAGSAHLFEEADVGLVGMGGHGVDQEDDLMAQLTEHRVSDLHVAAKRTALAANDLVLKGLSVGRQ